MSALLRSVVVLATFSVLGLSPAALLPQAAAEHRPVLPQGLISLERFNLTLSESGTFKETSHGTFEIDLGGGEDACTIVRSARADWNWNATFEVRTTPSAPYGQPNLAGSGKAVMSIELQDRETQDCTHSGDNGDHSEEHGVVDCIISDHQTIPFEFQGRFEPATGETWFTVPSLASPYQDEYGDPKAVPDACNEKGESSGRVQGQSFSDSWNEPAEGFLYVRPAAWLGPSIAEYRSGRMNESFATSAGVKVEEPGDWKLPLLYEVLADSGLASFQVTENTFHGGVSEKTYATTWSLPSLVTERHADDESVYTNPGAYVCEGARSLDHYPENEIDASATASGTCSMDSTIRASIDADICAERLERLKEHVDKVVNLHRPGESALEKQLIFWGQTSLGPAIQAALADARAAQLSGCGDEWGGEELARMAPQIVWLRDELVRIAKGRGLSQEGLTFLITVERTLLLMGFSGEGEGGSGETLGGKETWDADTKTWVWKVHSPVALHAYDDQGRHVGWNETKGAPDIMIPNSTFSGEPGGFQQITVPGGFYRVQVDGLSSGTYRLESEWNTTVASGAEQWTLPSEPGRSLATYYYMGPSWDGVGVEFSPVRTFATPESFRFFDSDDAPSGSDRGPEDEPAPNADTKRGFPRALGADAAVVVLVAFAVLAASKRRAA